MNATTGSPTRPLTLPEAATALGCTLHQLLHRLSRRPDLAGLLLRCGGRRLVMSDALPILREAVEHKR